MGKVRNALNRSNIYRVTIFFLFTNTDIYANKKKLLTRFVPAARTSNSHETFFFSYLGRAVNCSCLENLRHERHQLARQESLGTSVKKAKRRIPEALTPPAWLRSDIWILWSTSASRPDAFRSGIRDAVGGTTWTD